MYNARQHRKNAREPLSCGNMLNELEMNKNVGVNDKISNNQRPQIGNHRVIGENGKFQHEKLNKDVGLNLERQNNKGIRNEKVRPGQTQDLRAEANVKGDVNGDGKVNITDVTTLVNIVLSQPAEPAAKAKRTVEE